MYVPDLRVPEYTLVNVNLPTNGSVAILNAMAASDESFATGNVLSSSFVSTSFTESIPSFTSTGDGRY